ncbi:MAG TPA: AI-2E family transporter [Gallionella sp.]|nr:AI-2E family transporter [Gallionella sp.]
MLAQDKLRVYLSIILLASAAWLVHGFIHALLWAVVIGIATWPLRVLVEARTRLGNTGVAIVMTSIVAALFFFPIGYALFHAATEASAVAHWILGAQKSGIAVPAWLSGIPKVGGEAAGWWREYLSDPAALSALIGHGDNATLSEFVRRFGAQIAHRMLTLVFTIVVIFFVYRDGRELARKTLGLLNKLTGESGDRYGLQAAVAIRATVSGLVLVGLAEGLLIGISYVLAGAPHPALLSLATGVLATIPFAAPIIFGAVSIILLIQGSTVAGISVFAFGMLVLFIGDHFVRPNIIGDAVKLPFLWVLLGILGGVEVFGLIGLFVGPALMALVMTMWRDLTDPL